MQCRNAAKYPFNFRPLVCAAFGLGAGVAIGMHISGARALLAALLLLIAAYIMHAKKQRAATVMLLSAAAGLLRVAGYAFLPREEVSEIIEKARFSRNHTPTALMPKLRLLRGQYCWGTGARLGIFSGMHSAQAEYRTRWR